MAWTWGHCRRLVSDTCYDSPACGSVCGFDPRCRDCPRRCLRTSIPTSMPPCALHLNTRVSVVLARFKCRNHGIHLNQFPRTPWEVITPLRSCHAGPCPLTCHSKKLSLGVVPAKLLCGFFFCKVITTSKLFTNISPQYIMFVFQPSLLTNAHSRAHRGHKMQCVGSTVLGCDLNSMLFRCFLKKLFRSLRSRFS